MVEKYLKSYLNTHSNRGRNSRKRTLNGVHRGIATQQPWSDHARDCDRYERELVDIVKAVQIIDSDIHDTAKRAEIEELGIDTRAYDVRAADSDLAKMRAMLLSELYIFDHALKHLR